MRGRRRLCRLKHYTTLHYTTLHYTTLIIGALRSTGLERHVIAPTGFPAGSKSHNLDVIVKFALQSLPGRRRLLLVSQVLQIHIKLLSNSSLPPARLLLLKRFIERSVSVIFQRMSFTNESWNSMTYLELVAEKVDHTLSTFYLVYNCSLVVTDYGLLVWTPGEKPWKKK